MTSPNVTRTEQEVEQKENNCIIIERLTLKKATETVLKRMGYWKKKETTTVAIAR